jgi:hypothetical protein
MGAGFVVSLVMLRDRDLRRLGIIGVVANALLFVGQNWVRALESSSNRLAFVQRTTGRRQERKGSVEQRR